MKKLSLFVALMTLCAALSACGWTKEKLGLTRHGPDAGKVETRNELILPPEYSVRPKNLNIEEDEDSYLD
ncbi:MAG: hypothetical protein IKO06_01485 [Alphaproteobacteria bacterium]|nr:hypothetical protein [Alphaproteobacteria bacterium]